MSTDLTTVNRELSQQRHQLQSVIGMVRSATSPEAVQDLRAKTEAVKAWAKIHKQTKGLRLDFLRIEVEALVRLVELDGLDSLTQSEADAAQFLAALSPEERDDLISGAGNVTTAAGMVRAWRRDKDAATKHRNETAEWARRFTSNAPYAEYDENEMRLERNRRSWYHSRSRFSDVIEHYTEVGEPFTVQEIVDSFVEGTGFGEEVEGHATLMEGLREVARKAINAAPPEMWGDLTVPKVITTLIPDDDGNLVFVRVPVMSAKVRDADEMVAMREEQLKQDAAALDRLRAFRDKLHETGASPNDNIGAILLASLQSDAA